MIFARQNLLLCLFAAVSLPGFLNAQQGSFLYVPGNTSVGRTIAGYSVDASGALVPIPGSPFPTTNDNATTNAFPKTFAADPSGRFLYVGMDETFLPFIPPRIAVFAINPLSGALTPVSGSPFMVDSTAAPYITHITVSPTGRFLYLKYDSNALSSSDTIRVYAVNGTTGGLTLVSGPIATGQQAGAVHVDPQGKFAYIWSNGFGAFDGGSHGGVLRTYTVDPTTGILSLVPGSRLATGGNDDIVIDRAGRFAYIAKGTGVGVYAIDSTTGTLTEIPGSPFPAGARLSVGVALDPAGQFVYMNDIDWQLWVYRIDPTTGALAIVSTLQSPGRFPLLVSDSTGKYIYSQVLDEEIYGFAVDASTGDLKLIPGSPFPGGRRARGSPLVIPKPRTLIPPTTTAVASPAPNVAGWNNTSVTVTLDALDHSGWAGVKEIDYSFSGAQTDSGAISGNHGVVSIFPEGNTTLTYFATDKTENQETPKTLPVHIDRTPPVAGAVASPRGNRNDWNNSSVTVTFSGTDALSDIDACTAPRILTAEGAGQSASGTCQDKAGNVSPAVTAKVNIDKTPPTAIASLVPAANANGWNNTNVTISFSGTDNLAGIDSCSTPVNFNNEGAGQTATGFCSDKASNVSTPVTVIVNVDKTPPEAFSQFDPESKAVQIFGRDHFSGVPSGAITGTCVPTRWSIDDENKQGRRQSGSKDDKDDKQQNNAQLCTYTITDLAGNTLVLVAKVKSSNSGKTDDEDGHHLEFQVVSTKYNAGAVVNASYSSQSVEWSINKDKTLNKLSQSVVIGREKDRIEISAEYDSRKNQTIIETDKPKESRVVKSGLVLLRTATTNGALAIEY